MNDEEATLPLDASGLRDWLIRYIRSVLDLPEGDFPTSESFDSFGLDSSETVIMAGVMEEEFGLQLDPAMLFEHSSIDKLVAEFAARGLISA